MRITLLTGPDGAGKSTFFSRIAEMSVPGTGTIRLPHIAWEELPDSMLRDAAEFITVTGLQADREKDILLKSFALFGAMLLFKRLVEASADRQHLICERHPLIDTRVYAHFYARLLGPENNIGSHTRSFYESNRDLIDYILSGSELFPVSSDDRVRDVLAFIHDRFHIGKLYATEHMMEIFRIPLPDRIWYLRADPDILMERLSGRTGREAHEKRDVLELLDRTYMDLFKNEQLPCRVIDTGNLDPSAIDEICKQIGSDEA